MYSGNCFSTLRGNSDLGKRFSTLCCLSRVCVFSELSGLGPIECGCTTTRCRFSGGEESSDKKRKVAREREREGKQRRGERSSKRARARERGREK